MNSWHLSGTLDPSSREWEAVDEPALGGEEMLFPNADVHYCLMETPMRCALAELPPSLHPAIPAALGITFLKCREGPFGAFDAAIVGVACRSGIRPRHMTLAAFADSELAIRELRDRWGFPVRKATVSTLVYYDQVISSVEFSGRSILQVNTGRLVALHGPGASVVYTPSLNMARLNKRNTFVQVDLSAEFKRVARGTPTLHALELEALGILACAPTDPVSGTIARVDFKLHPVRFILDPSVSAENGGARQFARQSPVVT
jgi:hypothetical protein